MKRITTISAAILLTGCATNIGAPFHQAHIEPHPNTGTVIFYRPYKFQFGGSPFGRWAIDANGATYTAVGSDTYSKVELPPGSYKINANTSCIDPVSNIEIKAGKIHYVKVENSGFGDRWLCWINLEEVSESAAMPELKDMALQINDDLKLSGK